MTVLTERLAPDSKAAIVGTLLLTADERTRSRYRHDLPDDLTIYLKSLLIEQLQTQVTEEIAPFCPQAGAYQAHGHKHEHSHSPDSHSHNHSH